MSLLLRAPWPEKYLQQSVGRPETAPSFWPAAAAGGGLEQTAMHAHAIIHCSDE